MQTASFRLPPELLGALARSAVRRGRARSDLVRAALEEYLAKEESAAPATLGALVDALVTYEGSRIGDLATHSETHLRARFRARRRRSR